jgi:hypothetical protein
MSIISSKEIIFFPHPRYLGASFRLPASKLITFKWKNAASYYDVVANYKGERQSRMILLAAQ